MPAGSASAPEPEGEPEGEPSAEPGSEGSTPHAHAGDYNPSKLEAHEVHKNNYL